MNRANYRNVLLFISLALFTSACSSAFYDQNLNESQALRNCYAAIRDSKIQSIQDCGEYAIFHAPLYHEIDQSNPAMAACSFTINSLAYARMNYRHNKNLIRELEHQAQTDCNEKMIDQIPQLQYVSLDSYPKLRR